VRIDHGGRAHCLCARSVEVLRIGHLGGAYLGGADLRGANLTGATLSRDWRGQIALACTDGATVLPDNSAAPSPGASGTAESAACGGWH
jgi:hypothetical protein